MRSAITPSRPHGLTAVSGRLPNYPVPTLGCCFRTKAVGSGSPISSWCSQIQTEILRKAKRPRWLIVFCCQSASHWAWRMAIRSGSTVAGPIPWPGVDWTGRPRSVSRSRDQASSGSSSRASSAWAANIACSPVAMGERPGGQSSLLWSRLPSSTRSSHFCKFAMR